MAALLILAALICRLLLVLLGGGCQPGYVVHVLCDGRNFFYTHLLSLSSDAAALEPGKDQSRRK
ncbi:hypothetical protein TRIUR3_23583 [Triticum urartu]|uniref:Uncharacterized protein n=1 Tax=Triticum urartu TaxID=4572 RepID=M7ZJC4_TRIUA|nr:hypothetical protein TRIUR3_23583 [Triticum urartu]